jgi:hypothetical protein
MHHDVRSYEKGHPNPLFYRPTWVSLNGKWSFISMTKTKACKTDGPVDSGRLPKHQRSLCL